MNMVFAAVILGAFIMQAVCKIMRENGVATLWNMVAIGTAILASIAL